MANDTTQRTPEHLVGDQPAVRALLLPVKDLRNAKQRLAAVLTPDERFGLAQAMLADTIRAVHGVKRADKIFVVLPEKTLLNGKAEAILRAFTDYEFDNWKHTKLDAMIIYTQ